MKDTLSDKKGVVSITTFSLIVILVIFVLIFTYDYYSEKKETSLLLQDEATVLNSLNSFRSELLNVVIYNNTRLSYRDSYSQQDLMIFLENKSISGRIYLDKNIVRVNISSLGMYFCSSYNFSPSFGTVLSYNGSCISVTN